MELRINHLWKLCVLTLALLASPLFAADANTKSLLDPSADGIEKRFTPQSGSEDQVQVARSADAAAPGVIVTIQPGKAGYPGVMFKPDGAAWDLSAYGHIEAKIVNTSEKKLNFGLRVDNAGDWHDSPWNTEGFSLKPGETGTLKVIFGYQYGYKPGYDLKANAIADILLFATSKSEAVQAFRIVSLEAAGPAGEKPPVDPNSIRTKPKDGVVFGPGMPTEVAVDVEGQGGVTAAITDQKATVNFPEKGGQGALLKPAMGKWDWREASQVRVKLKNAGAAAVTPTVALAANGNSVTAAAELAPGAETEIVVPFAPEVPWKGIAAPAKAGYYGAQPGTGTGFASDAAAGVKISAKHTGAATVVVESIIADAPVDTLPDWLGKRPPVDGQWTKTFEDNFDGPTIDQTKWQVYGHNYYDKRTHWTKDDLILGDGVLKMRYEKKHGFQNDDPKQMLDMTNPKTSESDYACGYLETYGKWVQRYGYFESRMKLPKAPGMWPAFWMMPDRGPAAGPQWKRGDTANGATEMDIMEFLSRWGGHRFNIAVHFDGYGKDHKSIGGQCNYVQTDKDGFITVGLLWLPGQLIWYNNGKEFARWEDPRVSSVQSDIMFTMPSGGWDNNGIDDKQLPADFVIQYVRAWQRKDLASPVDGYEPAAPETKPADAPAAK